MFAKHVGSLPPSIIWHDIPKDVWVPAITLSKFCLIVRGDTPHAYLLLNAVRARCIPVTVSNNYQAYGEPFKLTLSTNNFSIYIDEASFLKNPIAELNKLPLLLLDEIKARLMELSNAQRILMTNHPQSLFVEAFVRETLTLRENVLPQVERRLPIQVLQDIVIISGQQIKYLYPSTVSIGQSSSSDNEPIIIVGVLSMTQEL